MRLFYIIIFFCIPCYFVSAASQIKTGYVVIKSTPTSFQPYHSQVKFHQQTAMENESIEKDLLNNYQHQNFTGILSLLFFTTIFLKFYFSISKKIVQTIRQNYWYSFKMLYPKHVFW